jgi:hypothetical protein
MKKYTYNMSLDEKYDVIFNNALDMSKNSILPQDETSRIMNAYMRASCANVEISEQNRQKINNKIGDSEIFLIGLLVCAMIVFVTVFVCLKFLSGEL